MQAVLDEIVEKVSILTRQEKRELIQLLQEEERKAESNEKNPSSNIEWLKLHRSEYAGNYVALKEGEFVSYGKTIKEADLRAKEKGVKNPFLHYIPADDEEVWGGW